MRTKKKIFIENDIFDISFYFQFRNLSEANDQAVKQLSALRDQIATIAKNNTTTDPYVLFSPT